MAMESLWEKILLRLDHSWNQRQCLDKAYTPIIKTSN